MADIQIPLSSAELHNVIIDSERLRVRDATYTIDEGVYVYFATLTGYTSGIVYHYVFTVDSGQFLTCSIMNDDWVLLDSFSIGQQLDLSAAITHAVVGPQVIFNSPGWTTPLYGIIGGRLVAAVAQQPLNPTTPSIDLAPGLVCSFADRVVWAIGNNVIVSNPGLDPRVLTSPNAFTTSGPVVAMFQRSGGNLVIVSTNEISEIPPDGLAGYSLGTTKSSSTHYKGLNARNADASNGAYIGLTRDGFMDLGTGKVTSLTQYRRGRRITKPVGPGIDDYRSGQIWATDTGFLISTIDGNCVEINTQFNTISWLYDTNYVFAPVGVGRTTEGRIIYALKDGIVCFYGTDHALQGGIATEVDVPGIASYLIQSVTVTVDGSGVNEVSSYVEDSLKSEVVPSAAGGISTTTGVWDAGVLLETRPRSRRQLRGGQARIDGIYLEVGAKGSGVRIHDATLTHDGQNPRRPTN